MAIESCNSWSRLALHPMEISINYKESRPQVSHLHGHLRSGLNYCLSPTKSKHPSNLDPAAGSMIEKTFVKSFVIRVFYKDIYLLKWFKELANGTQCPLRPSNHYECASLSVRHASTLSRIIAGECVARINC